MQNNCLVWIYLSRQGVPLPVQSRGVPIPVQSRGVPIPVQSRWVPIPVQSRGVPKQTEYSIWPKMYIMKQKTPSVLKTNKCMKNFRFDYYIGDKARHH